MTPPEASKVQEVESDPVKAEVAAQQAAKRKARIAANRSRSTNKPVSNQAWPSMTVGRKITKHDAHNWGEFTDVLQTQTGVPDGVVEPSKLICVFFGNEDMRDVLRALHPNELSARQRRRKAFELGRRITGLVRSMESDALDMEFGYLLDESPHLDARKSDPENSILETADLRAMEDRNELAKTHLWAPGEFTIKDGQEGYGPYGIGISIVEGERLAEGRALLHTAMEQELKMDLPFSSESWSPVVQVLDTHPLPVDGMELTLPVNRPFTIQLQAPHAYMDRSRVS